MSCDSCPKRKSAKDPLRHKSQFPRASYKPAECKRCLDCCWCDHCDTYKGTRDMIPWSNYCKQCHAANTEKQLTCPVCSKVKDKSLFGNSAVRCIACTFCTECGDERKPIHFLETTGYAENACSITSLRGRLPGLCLADDPLLITGEGLPSLSTIQSGCSTGKHPLFSTRLKECF